MLFWMTWYHFNERLIQLFLFDAVAAESRQIQPSRDVLRKRCSEKMQQICWRAPILKRDFKCVFNEITLWHGCSPVHLLHIFRTPFPKNISGRLFLKHNTIWRSEVLERIVFHQNCCFWEFHLAMASINRGLATNSGLEGQVQIGTFFVL